MRPIFVTFEVSKFDKLIEVNEEQSLNMLSIFVTFEVTKFDKLIEVNLEHK